MLGFKAEQIFMLKDYKRLNPKLLKEQKSEIWIYKFQPKKNGEKHLFFQNLTLEVPKLKKD